MATKPLAGKRLVKVTERRTKTDWAQFLELIAKRYHDAEKIILVMDNLNTHRPGALYEAYPPAEAKALWDRFEFVYTPRSRQLAECCRIGDTASLVRQCLNRWIDSMEVMSGEVLAWQFEGETHWKPKWTGSSPPRTRVSG